MSKQKQLILFISVSFRFEATRSEKKQKYRLIFFVKANEMEVEQVPIRFVAKKNLEAKRSHPNANSQNRRDT